MNRRTFLGGLTLGTLEVPLAAEAQQAGKVPRVGRVAGIAGADAAAYVAARQAQGVANGTINRELAVLGRMFRLAYENDKLLRLPVIRKLKEAAPRAEFFEREQYEAVRRRLPEDLQAATGSRTSSGGACRARSSSSSGVSST